MKLPVFATWLLLFSSWQALSQVPAEYIWREAGIAIRMPGKPVTGFPPMGTDNYQATPRAGNQVASSVHYDWYLVQYEPLTGNHIDDVKWQLDRVRKNFLTAGGFRRAPNDVSETAISLEGNPGTDIRALYIHMYKEHFALRVFIVKSQKKIYTVATGTRTFDMSAREETILEQRFAAFLNSFRLIKQ